MTFRNKQEIRLSGLCSEQCVKVWYTVSDDQQFAFAVCCSNLNLCCRDIGDEVIVFSYLSHFNVHINSVAGIK